VNPISPICETIPPPQRVRLFLGDALREVRLLRGLLRLSELAEHYRRIDRRLPGSTRRKGVRSVG
jgi:hypothetical protein